MSPVMGRDGVRNRLQVLVSGLSKVVAKYCRGHLRECENCKQPESAMPVAVSDDVIALDNPEIIAALVILTGIVATEGVTHHSGRVIDTKWLCPACIEDGINKLRLESLLRNMLATRGH
jgi:hypothetical protein